MTIAINQPLIQRSPTGDTGALAKQGGLQTQRRHTYLEIDSLLTSLIILCLRFSPAENLEKIQNLWNPTAATRPSPLQFSNVSDTTTPVCPVLSTHIPSISWEIPCMSSLLENDES